MTFEMDLYLERVPSPVTRSRMSVGASRSSSQLVAVDLATLARTNGVRDGADGAGDEALEARREGREDARLCLPPGFRCLYVEDDVELQYTLPQVRPRAQRADARARHARAHTHTQAMCGRAHTRSRR
jgi:hypothetical protein